MEALRTPLEEGEVRLARRDGVARYPARFQLVLAYVLANTVHVGCG
jgi:predicted ATPase with chaperone activity